MYCFICLFHQNMGVLYLTNFTQKFRNILEMNDFGKFVENLHKMTNFEKSPKSPQIDHYFFFRIFKKKKTILVASRRVLKNLKNHKKVWALISIDW